MAESTRGNQPGTAGQSENAGTGQAHETYEQAKRAAADGYAQARQTIKDMGGQAQQAARDWTQQTRTDTEAYVREQPWKALGIAAGIAFLVALLLRR